MGKIGKCKLCPPGTRDVLLIDDKCFGHQHNIEGAGDRDPLPPKVSKEKKKTKIKPVADKRKELDKEYSKERKKFLKLNPFCMAKLPGCTMLSTEVHHKAGRGTFYLEVKTWLPACRPCHNYIEANPKEAKAKGLSESRLNKRENDE